MWYLKYKFRHSDCIFSPKIKELGLSIFFYHLGCYKKGKHSYTSAMQQIVGEKKSVQKYVAYIRRHKDIAKCEVYGDAVLTLTKHPFTLGMYEKLYSPLLLFPAPSYLDSERFEVHEIACWDRRPLQDLIRALKRNKTTTHFEILRFAEKEMDNVYVSRLLPKLSPRQDSAIRLAYREGYYSFPRHASLDSLAAKAGVAKQTFRESLRKAEAKLIPLLIMK